MSEEIKEVISTIWPPTEDTRVEITYQHSDGRRVRYIRGRARRTDASDAKVRVYGNVCGTLGSAFMFEAFPNEYVCRGCVVEIEFKGKDGLLRLQSSPDFKTGISCFYCPDCCGYEMTKLIKRHDAEIRMMRVASNCVGLDDQDPLQDPLTKSGD